MSLDTVSQLYECIRSLMPQRADDATGHVVAALYQVNLARAKEAYPSHGIIDAMANLAPVEAHTPLGDVCVRTGQLMASLQENLAQEDAAWQEQPMRDGESPTLPPYQFDPALIARFVAGEPFSPETPRQKN